MVASITSIYAAALYKIAEEENGRLSPAAYNVISREAELRLIDYLSGDIEGIKPPEPYRTQKNKDWLRPVYATAKKNIGAIGIMPYPEDYYAYENMFFLGGVVQAEDCEGENTEQVDGCSVPIELLQGQQFYNRCNSFIKALRPSPSKPIAKETGSGFEILPKDLGSVKLEYYRYPVFGELKTRIDPVYQNEVVDPASTNYEWDAAVEPLLTWLIIQGYIYHNRERALLETNETTGKSIRK